MSIAVNDTKTISIVVLIALSGIGFLGYTNLQGNADDLELAQKGGSGITLKIAEIPGYSLGDGTKDEHQLLSVSMGVTKEGSAFSGQTRRRGSATFSDIAILKEVDASSPKFHISVADGRVYPLAEITFWRTSGETGGEAYLKYELKNVLVTSYSVSGSSQDGGVPVESITLNFEEIRIISWEIQPDGRIGTQKEETWKVEEGEK